MMIKFLDFKNTSELNRYNEFIQDRNIDTLFFHTIPYMELLRKTINCEAKYLIAYDNERIVGAFPLMSREGGYGTVINSLPFYGSYGGVVSEDSEVVNDLINYYFNFIDSSGIFSSVLVENPFSQNNDKLSLNSDFVINKVCQRTELPKSISFFDDFIKSFGESVASSIRKANKNDIQTSKSFYEIESIYDLHKANMETIGALPKPKIFFKNVTDIFKIGKEYDIYTAFFNAQPVAHLIVFYHKDTVEYYIPIVDPSFKQLQALSLLIEKAMREAVSKGYKYWNWGTTPSENQSLYKFKRKWGAKDFYYNTYVRINRRENIQIEKNVLLSSYPYFYVFPFEKMVK